jgi:hypothetical protein
MHSPLNVELVLRVVFRGTPRATSRVPQHISLIMTSQIVILIAFNLIYFHCESQITRFCFSYTCANIVFLQIKFTKFYFHLCAQKVPFYCARVPRIFGFSRTDSTNIKRIKIRVSEKGKIIFFEQILAAGLQHFRKIVSKSTNLKQRN